MVAAIGPAPPGATADERQCARALGIPYVDAKHEAEVEALRSPPAGSVVIVSPAHVFGRGDVYRSSTELVRRFLLRRIPAYVDGAINIVDVEDVARRACCSPTSAARPGERYILGTRNYTLAPPLRRPRAALGHRAAGARAAAARRRSRWPRRPRAARPDRRHPVRGPRRRALVDLPLGQGAARARLDDAPARGDGRGDRRLYRERELGDRLTRTGHRQPLPVAGLAVARLGEVAAVTAILLPLQDADEPALPVRARRP